MQARALELRSGLGVALAVGAAATGINAIQHMLTGSVGIDTMTMAILLGMAVRFAMPPKDSWAPGIRFASGRLLEFAVGLLGLSVDFDRLSESNNLLIAAVVAIVVVSIVVSYAVSRALGISQNMAILVACGNSICGNSAISAVAPAIRATPQDVASAITFSAFLGFILLLLLPLLDIFLGFSDQDFGIFAGMTIYAVPQVLAATAPVGLIAMQIGTMVKLLRVLMLGPVVMLMASMVHKTHALPMTKAVPQRQWLSGNRLFPWFILLFAALAVIRNTSPVPEAFVADTMTATKTLSVIAMAALGISVDIRQILTTSGRLILSVTLSLTFLCLISAIAVYAISSGTVSPA